MTSITTTTVSSYAASTQQNINTLEAGATFRNSTNSANGTTTTTVSTVNSDNTVTTTTYTIPSNMTEYYYMNTGSINRYKIEGEPDNANYVDALSQNLEFRINGDLVPISVVSSSANSFVINAKPSKSYAGGRGVLTIKDQGLIVYDKVVAIQDNSEPVTISRYDAYSAVMIQQASDLHDSN